MTAVLEALVKVVTADLLHHNLLEVLTACLSSLWIEHFKIYLALYDQNISLSTIWHFEVWLKDYLKEVGDKEMLSSQLW